jgi:hypothetical protein
VVDATLGAQTEAATTQHTIDLTASDGIPVESS